MNKFIINEDAIMKNVLISDVDIKLTDENYGSLEAFTDKLNNGTKGKFDTEYQIAYEEFDKIILDEPDMGIQIFFSQNGKSEKTYIEAISLEEYQELKDFVIKQADFSKTEEQVSSFMAWAKSGLYALAAAAFGIATYLMAVSLEEGDEITVSGRRKGFKQIMLWLAETLGSTGILILAILISAGFFFRALQAYKRSKKGMVVYRSV
jgi:hypothetical protein